jgi:hypothetical protein
VLAVVVVHLLMLVVQAVVVQVVIALVHQR